MSCDFEVGVYARMSLSYPPCRTAGFLVWITIEAVSLMYGFAGLQTNIICIQAKHCVCVCAVFLDTHN